METRNTDLKELLSKYDKNLTKKSTTEIKKDLSKLIELLDYSTIPMLFEFLTYLRAKNIKNNLLDELENFNPHNIENILNKYHSSNRSMLILFAKKVLNIDGNEIQIIFENKHFSKLFNFPLIETPVPESHGNEWQEAKDALHGKTGIICFCSSKNNSDQFFVVDPDFQNNKIINEYNSKQNLKEDFEYNNLGKIEATDNPLSYIRTLIRLTLIPIIRKSSTGETLRINLLDGTIEAINLSESSIPKNQNGYSYFNILEILNNKEKLIDITINTETKKMKGLEAFNLIIDSYASYFNLPIDFNENLLFLLENRTQFFEEIFPFPASIVLDLWNNYTNANSTQIKSNSIFNKTISSNHNVLETEKNNADSIFDIGIKEMLKGNKEAALCYFKDSEEKYNHVIQMCLQAQFVPEEIITDENPISLSS